MKKSEGDSSKAQGRGLQVEDIRLISDLRIMHAKVDELHNLVSNLKRRHNYAAILRCADQPVLNEDIVRVDEIYLWFLALKEERGIYEMKAI